VAAALGSLALRRRLPVALDRVAPEPA
jgi:hypothetical protein